MNIDNLILFLIAINLILTFIANVKPAAQSLKSKVGAIKVKPKSWLQAIPKYFSTAAYIGIILAFFEIGTYNVPFDWFDFIRLGLIPIAVAASWIQIWSFKHLEKWNSQDIIIYNNHKVITTGPYQYCRHPVYLTQIIHNITVGIILQSWLVLGIALLIEMPLILLRTPLEERVLAKYLQEYGHYQKKINRWFPVKSTLADSNEKNEPSAK